MSVDIQELDWKYVELGRIVLIGDTKLATVVEIIDNKRVLIDGPAIPRQAITLKKVTLTDIVLPNLPKGSRTATVHKRWAAADIDAKWAASAPAKKLANKARRAALNDFERFQVRVLKRKRFDAARRIAAKA